MSQYTIDQVIDMLYDRLYECGGSRTALARALKVSPGYITNVLNYNYLPGPAILNALGLRAVRIIVYEDFEVQEVSGV